MNVYRKPGFARLLAVLAVLALVATACGDDAEETVTTQAPTSETTAVPEAPDAEEEAPEAEEMEDEMEEMPMEPLRIAVVAPSASNDLAFTQSIVDAVNVIAAEHPGTEVAITDGTFIVEDAASALRGYAEEGYDLVIAHGSQYGGSLQEIAGDFPDTAFAWGTSADTLGQPNVSAYTAASDQGGYVMGVMAAALSDSSVIGRGRSHRGGRRQTLCGRVPQRSDRRRRGHRQHQLHRFVQRRGFGFRSSPGPHRLRC